VSLDDRLDQHLKVAVVDQHGTARLDMRGQVKVHRDDGGVGRQPMQVFAHIHLKAYQDHRLALRDRHLALETAHAHLGALQVG